MQDFNYCEAIEEAKADSAYFVPFTGFTIRRTFDSIAIDTKGATAHYPLSINTEALNRKLAAITVADPIPTRSRSPHPADATHGLAYALPLLLQRPV